MMSEKRFEVIDNSFSMWIVDTTLKEDRHEGNIYTAYDMCHKLNEFCEENEKLRKIGVMYQGHNPCSTCTYCLEDKLCCAEPIPILCDHAKEDFIQGLCKKHKQFVKSIRRYDDE